MKKLLIAILASFMCVAVTHASGGPNTPDAPDVVYLGGTVLVKLTRHENSLTANGVIYGLNPHETYTIWWLVGDEGGDFLVLNASGGVADGFGALSFGAALQTGEYEEGDTTPRVVFLGGELTNTGTAYVQMDVLAHGPKIPARVKEQMPDGDGVCIPAACTLIRPLGLSDTGSRHSAGSFFSSRRGGAQTQVECPGRRSRPEEHGTPVPSRSRLRPGTAPSGRPVTTSW